MRKECLIDSLPRTPENPLKVGVLVSGNGSNLQALIEKSFIATAAFKIATVISNKENAFALERAKLNGITQKFISHKAHDSKSDFERQIITHLDSYEVELVVLAGFMRVLSPVFFNEFKKPVVNVHPALCPAFPGMHAPKQALDKGVCVSGCTVHMVTEKVDDGPILMQETVPVYTNDSVESLTKRIQQKEHFLLPETIDAIAKGYLKRKKGGVYLSNREKLVGQATLSTSAPLPF